MLSTAQSLALLPARLNCGVVLNGKVSRSAFAGGKGNHRFREIRYLLSEL